MGRQRRRTRQRAMAETAFPLPPARRRRRARSPGCGRGRRRGGQDPRRRDRAALGAVDHRGRVDRADARLRRRQLVRRDEVGLAQQQHVGEGDLPGRLVAVLEAGQQVAGIDHGDDGVEPGHRAHLVVDEEGLRHRGAAPALEQVADDADQVAAHGAADAAVVHLDHRIAAAMLLGEQPVRQRGLAGDEITGQHRHRDPGALGKDGRGCRRQGRAPGVRDVASRFARQRTIR